MPENLKSQMIYSEGGLDLTQQILMKKEGVAIRHINYEGNLDGGYRRLSGFTKFDSATVPGQGVILGSWIYNNTVLAARATLADATKYDIYKSIGAGWTKITASPLTKNSSSIFRLYAVLYNWTGTPYITISDGANAVQRYDGSTIATLNASGSPADATIVEEYRGFLFATGFTTNIGAITWCAPLDDTDWTTAHGAGTAVVGDKVIGLKTFRDSLIIFCEKSIHKLTIDANGNFTIVPITRKIGCKDGKSIQEVGGDLLYLAPDGMRTIAGTAKIGDTEVGSVSSQIQDIIRTIDPTLYVLSSAVIRGKSQYRLFYSTVAATTSDASSQLGIVGSIRRFRDGNIGWEWGQIQGIKVSSSDSQFYNGSELIIHGGYDGYVYQQESGNSFDGTAISSVYQTPNFDMGDGSLRKTVYRVTVYGTSEGANTSLNMQIYYDFNNNPYAQPAIYTVTNFGGNSFIFDSSLALYDDLAVFDSSGNPRNRIPTSGSGFNFSFTFGMNNTIQASHTIQGFIVEFFVAGRR